MKQNLCFVLIFSATLLFAIVFFKKITLAFNSPQSDDSELCLETGTEFAYQTYSRDILEYSNREISPPSITKDWNKVSTTPIGGPHAIILNISLFDEKNKEIWIVDETTLVQHNYDTGNNHRFPDLDYGYMFINDDNEIYYLDINDNLLLKYDRLKKEFLKTKFPGVYGALDHVSYEHKFLANFSNGQLWIVAGRGIYSYDLDSSKLFYYELKVPNNNKEVIYTDSYPLPAIGFSEKFIAIADQQGHLLLFSKETRTYEYFYFRFSDKRGDYTSILEGNKASYTGIVIAQNQNIIFGDLGWMNIETREQFQFIKSGIFLSGPEDGIEKSVAPKLFPNDPGVIGETKDGRLWYSSSNKLVWMDMEEEKWCWVATSTHEIFETSEFLYIVHEKYLYRQPIKK